MPYVTSWSDEETLPGEIIERTGLVGIGFADETVLDRDRNGILWTRRAVRHGQGRPEFGMVHSLRQRRAMRLLLCQVCARPADRDADGVLWLLPDYYQEAEVWPENHDLAEPPICLSCVPVAIQLCPALRNGYLGIRARSAPLCGVRGAVYRAGSPEPVAVREDLIHFRNPSIRWTVADQLLRALHDCTMVDLDRGARHESGS